MASVMDYLSGASATSTSNDIRYYNNQREPNTSLGKNEFLQILVTQLRYQDPTSPSSDTEFIGQLAQFTSVEQLSNMASSMSQTQAYSMVGKYVYGEIRDGDTGKTETFAGKVESIVYQNNEAYAIVGDWKVPVSAITEIYDSDLFDPLAMGTGSILQSAALIGKEVNATYYKLPDTTEGGDEKTTDENGDEVTAETPEAVKVEVTGTVDRISVSEGNLYIHVIDAEGEEHKVSVTAITGIK